MSEHVRVPDGVHPALPSDAQTQKMAVAFFDLSRIAEWSSSDQDASVASFLQQFYALADERIRAAGGRIVKLMGDAGLVVFPEEAAESGILALCALTQAARECGHGFGFDVYLNVSVHVGSVLAGSFGPPGGERFDVIGKVVNIAARLGRRGVVLSAQAFRCLSSEARACFEKIKRPTTYRFRR